MPHLSSDHVSVIIHAVYFRLSSGGRSESEEGRSRQSVNRRVFGRGPEERMRARKSVMVEAKFKGDSSDARQVCVVLQNSFRASQHFIGPANACIYRYGGTFCQLCRVMPAALLLLSTPRTSDVDVALRRRVGSGSPALGFFIIHRSALILLGEHIGYELIDDDNLPATGGHTDTVGVVG